MSDRIDELNKEFDNYIKQKKIEKIADGLNKASGILEDAINRHHRYDQFRKLKKEGKDVLLLNLSSEEKAQFGELFKNERNI